MPSPDIVACTPKTLEQYLAAIDNLSTSIAEGRDDEALRLLRGLVQKITVYPRRMGEPYALILLVILLLCSILRWDRWCRGGTQIASITRLK